MSTNTVPPTNIATVGLLTPRTRSSCRREFPRFQYTALLIGLGFLLGALLGCGKTSSDATAQPVQIMVAASTKDAITEIAALYTKESGIEVKVVAESSSKLATQITNDAPADLFLSANDQWADFVKEKGYAQETQPLLTNNLVLIVPKGNPARVNKPKDLTNAAVKRVALAGPAVPAGIYGRQALSKLGLLQALENDRKIVSGEDVRVTLTFVERGEVDAGIVYDTDARITDEIEIVHRFEPATHDPIRYPLVLLKAGHEKESARKFFAFLQSAQARAVFQKHGFTTLAGK